MKLKHMSMSKLKPLFMGQCAARTPDDACFLIILRIAIPTAAAVRNHVAGNMIYLPRISRLSCSIGHGFPYVW